jgi:hypothetical protein
MAGGGEKGAGKKHPLTPFKGGLKDTSHEP